VITLVGINCLLAEKMGGLYRFDAAEYKYGKEITP
jgi:hypothetical protein